MEFTNWLTLATVLLFGAMSPGPSLGVVVESTARSGVGHGVVTAMAHGLGVGCYALLATLGLVVLISGSPLLFQLLQLAGAAFLLYLAYQALVNAGSEAPAAELPVRTYWQSVSGGFFTAFLNPKIALVFLALFSQFVTPETSLAVKWLMALTAMLVDALWYCVVVLLVGYSGVLARFEGRGHWAQRVFGVLLIVIALRVAAPVLGFL